ncbi:MAG: HEPN domain-containing protein [Nanoarchaeota archaeon]|nr:HEPN domain-containing protein [Nanoarchaeota archaeon]
MDSKVKIYLQRALNELSIAKLLFNISNNDEGKSKFYVSEGTTYYSSVISHSYYTIFYSAKAILLTKNIKTESPQVHKKTYEIFKTIFVDSGILDVELLKIYKKMVIRADGLLQIFKDEKWKRGHFTYHTIPQANKNPAEESMKNATIFLKNIRVIIEK